jgi:hypothetical protein
MYYRARPAVAPSRLQQQRPRLVPLAIDAPVCPCPGGTAEFQFHKRPEPFPHQRSAERMVDVHRLHEFRDRIGVQGLRQINAHLVTSHFPDAATAFSTENGSKKNDFLLVGQRREA